MFLFTGFIPSAIRVPRGSIDVDKDLNRKSAAASIHSNFWSSVFVLLH